MKKRAWLLLVIALLALAALAVRASGGGFLKRLASLHGAVGGH